MNLKEYIKKHEKDEFLGIIVEGKRGYGMSSYAFKIELKEIEGIEK